MSTFVKNVLFLLFFVFFASGIFYMSTNPSFIHFSEKIFLGEVNEKTHILLMNQAVSRYAGVYNSSSRRSYTSPTNGSISNQTFSFYKRALSK